MNQRSASKEGRFAASMGVISYFQGITIVSLIKGTTQINYVEEIG